MPLDKYEAIRQFVKSKLGDPVVALCENETESFKTAVANASFAFWTSLPHTKVNTLPGSFTSGLVVVNIDDIMNTNFPDPNDRDEAYFIGVQRYDINQPFGAVFGATSLDLCLSGSGGWNVESPFGRSGGYGRYRNISDQLNLLNTQEDILFGELDINYDDFANTIEFILPAISGVSAAGSSLTAQVWYGFGFTPEKTIEILGMRNFTLFRKMTAFEFIDAIIEARSAIVLSNADYQVQIAPLEKKREALKEEIEKELISMARMPNVWG